MVSRTVQLISAYMCDDLLMWDIQGLSNTSMTPRFADGIQTCVCYVHG